MWPVAAAGNRGSGMNVTLSTRFVWSPVFPGTGDYETCHLASMRSDRLLPAMRKRYRWESKQR
jgi:hypothetical protein